jgi:hypothetical protein
MPSSDFPSMLSDAMKHHIPPGSEWLPMAIAVAVALVGLVFMVKGARLAPLLAAIVFGGLGGVAGPCLAHLISAPLWPTVAASSAAGLVLGLVLFRLWLAILVGACLSLASLGLYTEQVLRHPLNNYLASGLDREQQLVTLPEAQPAGAAAATWQSELGGVWSHLSTNVPHFQASFFAIVISTGLAGVLFALLFPKVARAFWAASLGTGLLLLAVYGLAQLRWPAARDWINQWGLILFGVLWCISILYNLVDIQGVRLRKTPAADKRAAAK